MIIHDKSHALMIRVYVLYSDYEMVIVVRVIYEIALLLVIGEYVVMLMYNHELYLCDERLIREMRSVIQVCTVKTL